MTPEEFEEASPAEVKRWMAENKLICTVFRKITARCANAQEANELFQTTLLAFVEKMDLENLSAEELRAVLEPELVKMRLAAEVKLKNVQEIGAYLKAL